MSEIVVARLKEKPSINQFGNFVLINNDFKGLYSIIMPTTHAKLKRKLTSKADNGLKQNKIIPANEIADRLSYSLKNNGANMPNIAITEALTTETENPHKYA